MPRSLWRRCTWSKEWEDTLKIGFGMWAYSKDQLMDVSRLIWWGITIVGRKLTVYSLIAEGGLFHFVLMHETPL
ncbi:hypothetical protein BC936DRAFT_141266 [Jimgerdemannia flammicorona]|uniref:Uncharacterized protein n=1 Tax=Jimgerdemannia flammicorona TaxID=994334 RepID=A0A433A2J8_9FUNG|nr:hypothetical protein BC936DRAFT_141266 [Jimgerdemannia flammicorona]